MNPIGKIISIATCLIAKVLVINKMNKYQKISKQKLKTKNKYAIGRFLDMAPRNVKPLPLGKPFLEVLIDRSIDNYVAN